MLLLLALLLGSGAAGLWSARREAARVRRTLAAGLSHDLRTPPARIRIFTEMLLMDRHPSLNERVAWLQSIERETHRLGDVAGQPPPVIHVDEPDAFPVRQTIDLGALVEDVAAGFSERAPATGVRLVDDPPSRISVLADADPLRHVLVNLLDNAFRFGSPGQTVSVSLTTADDRAVLTLTDQ